MRSRTLRREGIQFFRRRMVRRQIIHEFNRSLVLISDPEALQASIATRIQELFGPDVIIILQLDRERGVFSPSYSVGIELSELADIRFHQRGRLAKWLLVNESCLVVERARQVYEFLSPSERGGLERLKTSVCVPLIALNRLTGIILLGSRGEHWEVTDGDLELLELLANQAGLAFENAALYQQQRDRLRRLHRAERLAAAGQLAAGVAHEIRNPLAAIRSTIQYVLQRFPQQDPNRELVAELLDEVDRIDRTVNGLLSLTRSSHFEPVETNVIDVIEQSLMLVQAQARRQAVSIDRHYERDHLMVMGDPHQLKQVFLNLMLNALQAMPGGGRLTVSVCGWHPEYALRGDRWTQIEIADTGPGIPPEHLDRIFDPFFTTKRDGTGLGLSICHSIVHQHEGEIEVQSQPGRGTTAVVRLPRV